MRAMFLLLLLAPGAGCSPAPVAAEETEKPGNRATAMPASLRCQRAADCTPDPSCYWSEPSCVAAASVSAQKCEDADPEDKSRVKFTCGCQEGQCVPQTE